MVILDIDMPKNCMECPLFDDRWDYPTCYANQNSSGYTFPITEKRMSFCPIKCDIEDIKTEIADYTLSDDEKTDMDEDSIKWGIKIAYDIIDKHTKGDSDADSN